jgi:integral membrane protein
MHDRLFKIFRIVGIAEGISFLLLLGVAMPLKYMAGMPMAVSVAGMMHGVLFLAYLYLLYDCRMAAHWSFSTAARGVVAALVPFGPFVFERQIKKPR